MFKGKYFISNKFPNKKSATILGKSISQNNLIYPNITCKNNNLKKKASLFDTNIEAFGQNQLIGNYIS